MSRQIVVCQTKEDLFEAAAQFVSQLLAGQPDTAKRYSVALSGGSTPRGLFSRLVVEPYRSQVDWTSLQVFWGDERSVPADHPDSNYRMAKETLLDHVPLLSGQVFRIEGELPAKDAAVQYEKILQQVFSSCEREIPRFDLILLGMGPDGHTASLFPETSVLEETTLWVAAPWVEKFQTYRITFTAPILNAAKQIVFLVSGLDKAKAVQAVLEGPPQPYRYPAQLVHSAQGNVIWFMDKDAASRLQVTPTREWNRENCGRQEE